MEAGQWVPSEAVETGAVVAAVFVEAVDVAVADVAVVVVVVAVAAAAAAAAVAVAAAVADAAAAAVGAVVAAPQLESDVGACVPAGTGHFWAMLSADNPVSRKLTDATICWRNGGVPPRQVRCYSALYGTTAVASAVP